MSKQTVLAMGTLAFGLLFGSTAAYSDGDMWIGSSEVTCQATNGGTCVQHGRTYQRKVVVEYAENVCQANNGGDCWQASNNQSYRHCERDGDGTVTCWN